MPNRYYFFQVGYVFNYELSDPTVTSFRLNDVFRPSGLSAIIRRRLRAELPEDADRTPSSSSASTTSADIFYGFLGQSMDFSVSRVVGGDPSLIIGYSSNSAYTPTAIRQKVSASFNQGAAAGTSDVTGGMYYQEYLDLRAAITPKAEQRLGTFQGVIYDRQMRIRGLKFANQTFMKAPGHSGFSTSSDPSLTLFDSDRI